MLDNNSIKDCKFQRLSGADRRNIERLFFTGNSKSHIARYIQKHRSTICREVNNKRNWDFVRYNNKVRRSYSAKKAQENCELAKSNCGAKFKFTKDDSLQLIEQQFFETKYAPDQIIGRYGAPFTSRTFYNYVRLDISRVKPHDLLRKVGRKRVKGKKIRENKRLVGKSISQRPEEIGNRTKFGHGEGDCIVDALHNAILVTQERVSKKFVMRKLERLDSKEGLLKMAEAKEQLKLKSVTVDNGIEFYKLIQLENESFSVYYTHPYSAWEKGGVENLNSIIRRFIPKGCNLSSITAETLARIENHINNMPRKILNYKTANEVFDELSSA